MEIANVAGADGLKAMLDSISRLPYRMLIEVSSRVPTAPGLETNGAYMGAEEVRAIMDWQESISLGELDPSKILLVKDEYIEKIADTLARRKIVNGHAIGRLGQELNVYASAGISDDHECVTEEELLQRLRVGMSDRYECVGSGGQHRTQFGCPHRRCTEREAASGQSDVLYR